MPQKQQDQEWICTAETDPEIVSSCLMKLSLNIQREHLCLAVG